MMETDVRCDPRTNPYLAHLLERVSFEWKNIKPLRFYNPIKKIDVGFFLSEEQNDSLLLLLPTMGTGVHTHRGMLNGTVHYIGSIVSGESPVLKHKYQNNSLETRTEADDIVLEHKAGETFETGPNARFIGYHNIHPRSPIALRIRK